MNAQDPTLNTQAATVPTSAAGRGPVPGFFVDLLLFVVLLLVFSIAAGMLWGLFEGIKAGLDGRPIASIGEPGALAMIWITALGTGGATLVLYAWRRRASAGERGHAWRAALQATTWGWTVLVALLLFAFTSAVDWLLVRSDIQIVPTNEAMLEAGLSSHPWLVLVFAVLLAPAYEELLFRRVLFGRLWAAGRPWLGLVLSSVAFALLHEIPGVTGNTFGATLVLWLVYGTIGAGLAWLYWRTRTLWAPFAAHALNNLVGCLLMLAG